eukprot:1836645-Prymnesium_polylepis.1
MGDVKLGVEARGCHVGILWGGWLSHEGPTWALEALTDAVDGREGAEDEGEGRGEAEDLLVGERLGDSRVRAGEGEGLSLIHI